MQAKKFFLISFVFASMVGCASSTTTFDGSKKIELTQSEIDLMLKKARSEERVLVIKEMKKQKQQRMVFDELLIKEGKQPKFTEHYQQPMNKKKLFDEMSRKQIKAEIDKGVRIATAEGGISKIKPSNRNVTLYQTIDGVNYYRCAANAMIPIKSEQGTRYHFSKKELSATLCKKSRDKTVMLELQNRLYALGYLKSDFLNKTQLVDGVWGVSTLEAVKAYQIDNELLFGQMTIQTLEHIGVFASYSDYAFETVALAKVGEVDEVANLKEVAVPESEQNISENSIVKESLTDETLEKNVSETNVNILADNNKNVNAPANTTLINGQYVLKIMPKNRKRVFYKTVSGASYYRCAANSMIGVKADNGSWQYSKDKKELSATLCKANRDSATMTDLQYELYEKGYMPANGTPIGFLISGKWDKRTLKAVKAYQKANGLLYGQLTIETLESLGVFKPHKERILNPEATKKIRLANEKPDTESESSIQNGLQTITTIDAKQAEQLAEIKTPGSTVVKPAVKKVGKEKASDIEQIPFIPLKVRLADKSINPTTFVPQNSVAKPYAYVGNFALKRCRARSLLPMKTEDGIVYNEDNKDYRATLCKFNRTPKLMTRLQTALRDKGFLKPLERQIDVLIDRRWNARTLEAVKAYQKHHGLLYGQLTIEVLEHLGVFVKND